MHRFPIDFALAPKSLGSRISGGALATTARALRMMGHVTVKFRWTTPAKDYARLARSVMKAKNNTTVVEAQSLRHNIRLFRYVLSDVRRICGCLRRLFASQSLVVIMNIDKPKGMLAKKSLLHCHLFAFLAFQGENRNFLS